MVLAPASHEITRLYILTKSTADSGYILAIQTDQLEWIDRDVIDQQIKMADRYRLGRGSKPRSQRHNSSEREHKKPEEARVSALLGFRLENGASKD